MHTKIMTITTLLILNVLSAGCLEESRSKSLVTDGATVQQAATGFRFTEGPASDADGNVYFTDIPNSRIHKHAIDGTISTFVENSDKANGLYFDNRGDMIACAGGTGKVVKIDASGSVHDLLTEYKSKPFNSPNDLWLDRKGGIYFTDPRYGNRDNLPQDGEHVYYLKPDGKTVIRVIDNMVRPNGLIGTPNGKTLYVADNGASMTYKYAINEDGSLGDGKLYIMEGSDGMTIDEYGNIYLTTDAVMIYNPKGKLIEKIETPERPANVTFGGPDKNILFITARKSLYTIKMNTKAP